MPPPVSARAKGSTGAVFVLVLWLGEPGVIRQIPLLIAPAHGTCVNRLPLSPTQDRLAGAVGRVAHTVSSIPHEHAGSQCQETWQCSASRPKFPA